MSSSRRSESLQVVLSHIWLVDVQVRLLLSGAQPPGRHCRSTMLHNVAQCRTMSHNVAQCRTMSYNAACPSHVLTVNNCRAIGSVRCELSPFRRRQVASSLPPAAPAARFVAASRVRPTQGVVNYFCDRFHNLIKNSPYYFFIIR